MSCRSIGKSGAPLELRQEIQAGGPRNAGLAEFDAAHWLEKSARPLSIAADLLNTLDKGEAAVIQLALNQNVPAVVIDEAAGRRGLSVTGSIGVLLRAKREGYQFSMSEAISSMKARGIWLSNRVIAFALAQAGETP